MRLKWTQMGVGALLLAAIVLAGCEAGESASGTWTVTDGDGHVMILRLNQIGNFVWGNAEGGGYSVPIHGTMSGDTLTIRVQGGGHDVTLTGKVDGNTMKGTVKDAVTGLTRSFTATRE